MYVMYMYTDMSVLFTFPKELQHYLVLWADKREIKRTKEVAAL